MTTGLFEYGAARSARAAAPLAERMRPRNLEEFVGQEHVTGPDGLIQAALEKDRLFSMILWGPPGCGKTTLANIIAGETRSHFVQISAVLSGVKDIRAVIEAARNQREMYRRRTILFVDEIHRFNKAQQDAFLQHVESGLITLIGATTENPSFEVIAALLSRCRVVTLNPLTAEQMEIVVNRTLKDQERGLGSHGLRLDTAAREFLIRSADGDVRSVLNSLEIVAGLLATGTEGGPTENSVGVELLEHALQRKALRYDKNGEEHYNLISALHKSLRGSDPDAALYWLARMLEAGEDAQYVARRMVRFASEDVGNADPYALQLSLAAAEAYRFLGRPEGELALAQAAVYLAAAPKSNSVYTAYGRAQHSARASGALPVPLHLRNAPTKLMKSLGYGRGYRYAHDDPDGYIPQAYLPDELEARRFYQPTERGYEKTIGRRLEAWRRRLAASRRRDSPPPVEPGAN